MLKTGAQHIESLRDGREVYINGELVADVTKHKAFKNAIKTVGRMYDHVSDPENSELMTYKLADGTESYNRLWQLPTSHKELVERRAAIESWLGLHGGFFGRSPDHVGSAISGLMMNLEMFESYDKERASALKSYYEYARDNDIFLTYVIVNPQADRSKSAHEQQDEFLSAGVVKEDKEGITIRGAKMLATGGVMANEVYVTSIQPLQPGDEKYAISAVVKMNAPGLKLLSRNSYEEKSDNVFDHPLANQFDENDAIVYFDDVKIPWDRVFINQDIEMCQKQFHGGQGRMHVYINYQAQVRLMIKLKFLMGIAKGISDVNGTSNFPQVREILGQLAADAQMIDAFVHSMEIKGGVNEGGYFLPDTSTLYSAQVLAQQLYPRLINQIRELAGGGVIMLPSSVHDFSNPELAKLIDKTQQSPTTDSKGRIKFFRLAWDALGSEFASRHTQYEMFYAGASFVTKGHCYRNYDWERSAGLVKTILDSYTLEDVLKKT